MDARSIGRLLASPAGGLLLNAGAHLLDKDRLRQPFIQAVDWWLHALLASDELTSPAWRRIRQERLWIALSVLHTVDRLAGRRAIAPGVVRVIPQLWARALCMPEAQRPAIARFRREHGTRPPWFIAISPGLACNLRCAGCYADSGPEGAKLPWPILDRIISEARDLWDVPMVVFAGGEPLVYRSEGHDLLDMVEKHPTCMFVVYTNGTLIDEQTAARMARLVNVVTAISVEGLRERTDARRGAGVFDRVLEAMACLRRARFPFGISMTATRANCAEIMSDEVLDFYFGEQGAFFGFVFQYMPIGRGATLEEMPTPQQRLELWRRSWEVVAGKRYFLFDFWNHGPLVRGCMAAGREAGYLHIDWNGQVMPCVFAPYSAGNIQEVYAHGGTLEDVWHAPFLQAVRRWQLDYGWGEAEPSRQGNWLRPCPIRDHHRLFRQWVEQHRPDPENDQAGEALLDADYYEGMAAYGTELGRLSQRIWEEEYLDLRTAR